MSERGEKFVNDEEKNTQDVGEGSDMKNHTLYKKPTMKWDLQEKLKW